MKLSPCSTLLISLVLASTSGIFAQSAPSAAERAEDLRLQLLDVQARVASLQERVRQLDEDIKPENIEHSLAGIGSTRPEELRETRRRQLQIEKDSLVTQLAILEKSQTNLEASIANADANAYHQSARGTSSAGLNLMQLRQVSPLPKWITLLLLMLLSVLGISGLALVIRRLQRSRGQRAV